MPNPVAEIMPAMTAVPSAIWAPEPAPLLKASGTTPRMKQSEVMIIGRKRRREASNVAANSSFPL